MVWTDSVVTDFIFAILKIRLFFCGFVVVEVGAGVSFHSDFLAVAHSGMAFLHEHLLHVGVIFAEIHRVCDGDGSGEFLNIVLGSDIGKGPAL